MDYALLQKLGDTVLVGDWFIFCKSSWLSRIGMDQLLVASGLGQVVPKPAILLRNQEISLPGVTLPKKDFPSGRLLSLTADKDLYRADQDTVRLLIAAPQQSGQTLKLSLHLSGNPYGEYPILLNEFGLFLWSMQGLPEGEYEARVEGSDVCRFEVAEYRLAQLNAELLDQRLQNTTLHFTLRVTAFGQPYTGPIEYELLEMGKRVGQRVKRVCDTNGEFAGTCKLNGEGPYTLNVFAGERSASVALKGSQKERRETLVISRLGTIHEISLLPLPDAQICRGISVAKGGENTEPLLVRNVVGREIEITSRVALEMLHVVVVDPLKSTCEEYVSEQLPAGQSQKFLCPSPYSVVLLGAFIEGKAWEGWCTVLRPPDLEVHCQAPQKIRPGARMTIKITTNVPDRKVPVQLIVKDQRLIASSDPQMELAACIKKNLTDWDKQGKPGVVERTLADAYPVVPPGGGFGGPFPVFSAPVPMMQSAPVRATGLARPMMALAAAPVAATAAVSEAARNRMSEGTAQSVTTATAAPVLTRVRMQFPEVIYNNLLQVEGEAIVEIKLGDGMTRYTLEAFALLPETLDWQRAEATVEAVQPVYGELTVSPFVFPGDPVMGRLDVGAASGQAVVEVRHDDEPVQLFSEDGTEISADQAVASGTVLRFPVKPGMITAIVRDAATDEADVSERYVTEPGKLRHIMRRLRFLTPGDEATLQEANVLEIKLMPGLEQPFQFFVEGAIKYPFGCIEQTSCRLLAMFTGYIANLDKPAVAGEYEAVIPAWYQRLKSMYLPNKGFCFYPPENGVQPRTDTYYAPKAVKHLLKLPESKQAGMPSPALREILEDIDKMVEDAAAYYKIKSTPDKIENCEDAYRVLRYSSVQQKKSEALTFVRSRLVERDGKVQVAVKPGQPSYLLHGMAVSTREETAYAAATLLMGGESADLTRAIAATNFLTSQLNEEGRLYSTVDTTACLTLLVALRAAGVVTNAESGRVEVNGQEMALGDALAFREKVQHVRSLEGVIAVEITSEVIEDWGTFQNNIPVEVRLERAKRVQSSYKVGDALDLVIRVKQYEPGLLAHICLPDALARVVGGGQVKRFSLDFCEKNELRVPLAAVGSTVLPEAKGSNTLLKWLGLSGKKQGERHEQHFAVIVRNMFKEEEAGNPGLLTVSID